MASAHDLYLECLLVQRLETTPFIYLSQEPKVYTYEYLPIFRTITEMIPPMTAMPTKTPTMIPTMSPLTSHLNDTEKKKAEFPD